MKRTVLGVFALLALASIGIAGEPIIIGETITFDSKVMDEERTILVSTPPGYEQGTERYPVLYMTDGDGHLSHTRGTVDFLARNGLMPQLIIVGVTNTDRTRDLTPTTVPTREVNGRLREFPTSGGADRFLDFFATELFPFVDENYRTLPMRIFSGHSFGGLFALNAFCTRPEMFKAVLSVSPSLNWDEDFALKQAKSFFKSQDTLNRSLFVAMADEERGDPKPTRLDRLEATLAGTESDGFRWKVVHMPDENHGSVVLRAHYWGLKMIFDGWQLPTNPDSRAFEGTLEDLERHYAELSKQYGFNVVPSENTINIVGYQILGREDYDEAIAVFLSNVRLYPESANVYDSLGEAYENAGQYEEALKAYTTAVENAHKTGDVRLGIFTDNRDRVKNLLAEKKAD